MENKDYLRFIHDLFEFNDEDSFLNLGRNFTKNPNLIEVEPPSSWGRSEKREPRKFLVEILVFTLMPNHFHLILKEIRPNGISKFMQKIGTGYTMYFNQKYERSGCLFQSKFKAVMLEEHAHFLHLPHYIHLNPLKLINSSIDGGRTSINWEGRLEFLENYRWSSFPDYIGKKNFPSVTQREFLLDFFEGEKGYKKEAIEWLKEENNDLGDIKDVILK